MVEHRFAGLPEAESAREPVLGREPGEGLVLRGVKVSRLRNGMTLAVREDGRFPKAHFRLEVKAGSAWERPEEAGVSHLIEHMAFCTAEDGMDMHERAELAGGSVYASTGRDYTMFFAELPAARWEEALSLLHRLAFEMPLTQEALDAEREIVVAELREDASRSDRGIFDLTLETMFEGTPYGRGIMGTENSLRGITLDTVRDYVRRRYQPRDMVLAVVGGVDAEALLAAADALFGGIPNTGTQEPAPALSVRDFKPGLSAGVKRMQSFGSWVCMAFPIPFVRPRLAASLIMLAELLEGSEAAYLKRRLCFETGVARHVQVTYEGFERGGAFVIEAFAGTGDAEACLRELAAALASLQVADISDGEIALARARLADGNIRSLEKADVIAEMISDENLHVAASATGWIPVASFRDIGREQLRQAMELCFASGSATATAMPDSSEGAPALDAEAVRGAVLEGWPGLASQDDEGAGEAPCAAGPELIELGGGCSLALLPDASLPFVAATLSFSGGESLAAEMGVRGMDVLARILCLGQGGRNRQETAAWLYERSASFHACRSVDDFCLNMTAPRRCAPELFSLMRQTMEEPVFHEEDFEREKGLARFEDDRMLRYFLLVRRLLLKDGPYKSVGWPDDPGSLDLSELAALWQAQAARPWTLCVAGDIDREGVEAFAASLPRPTAPAIQARAPEWEEFSSFSSGCEPSEQAVYALFFRTPGEASPDRPAVELLLRCLNGAGGLLYRALRQERHICYSAEALDWCEGGAGLVGIFVLTSPEHLDEAAEALEDVIFSLHEEELTDEELARGMVAAETFVQAARQSMEGRAFIGAKQVRQGRGPAGNWAEGLKDVTAARIREAVRRYFVLEEAAELCVEPVDGDDDC